MSLEGVFQAESLVAFLTLTAIEIVLGIDNIIFITVLVERLPPDQRRRARRLGLGLAMVARLALLFTLSWFMGLTRPLVTVVGREISLRDLILIAGGLFLLAKSTFEIHGKLEGSIDEKRQQVPGSGFVAVLAQIALLDMVFSIDSVITAIGLAREVVIMAAAIVVAVGVMLLSAAPLGRFVGRHPTLKMLALSFLLLIGTTLVADGLGFHFPKGYVYFAMAFSAFVETLNLRSRAVEEAG